VGKQSTEPVPVEASRVAWDTLEAFARDGAQRLLQRVLEEEVDQLLGRRRYERTAAAKRFKKVENATAVIWKTLLVAERSLRGLDATECLAEVAEGVLYVNGERIKRVNEKAAA
jgi:hypothetical protein